TIARHPLAGRNNAISLRLGPPYGSIIGAWHPYGILAAWVRRTWRWTGHSPCSRHHPYVGMVRWSRRLRRLLQSALAGLYGSIRKASFGLGMEGCDSSRRPATNSGNIPGSFEFCKAVRSGGPLPPLRRRISLVSLSR